MPTDPSAPLLTACDIAQGVLDGRIPPRAATDGAQAAIAFANEVINAVVDFDAAAAEPQIADLERRLRAGERPLLAGVPILVKDHIHVAGWPVTQGSRVHRNDVASADDLAVARLRAAGAILVGRTNMSEFGCKGVTTNRLYGPTRHPLDPDLTPGGSSGGAAAALAAGFAPLALASDGGGSARRPAAHAGVVGFKPSAGAVPEPRRLSQTSVLAPMARNVADAALLFDAIRGVHPSDPYSVALPLPSRQGAGGLRIAYSPRFGLNVPLDSDVEATLERAVERLRNSGETIQRLDPPWPKTLGEDALMPLQYAGLAATYGEVWRKEPDLFDPDIGEQIEKGLALTAVDVARATAMSVAAASVLAKFFADGIDLLISPTTPCVAWPHRDLGPATIGGQPVGPRGHAVFTPLVNHALCPAISLPAGTGRAALPVGLQLVAPRFADLALLDVAARFEAILSA